MNDRLRVFVASSSEQVEVAARVARALDSPGIDAVTWREGVFTFSRAYIESLEAELDRADFAVVVMTGDDLGVVREATVNLPRDNVVFELGLFIGRLGRERAFFLVEMGSGTRVASDLAGVKPVEFHAPGTPGASARPTLEEQAEQLKVEVLAGGPRFKPSRRSREEHEALWRFNTRIAGHWWERMRAGEDDMSALTYMTVKVDEVRNTPALHGDVYDLDGTRLAEWTSVVCGVVLGDRPVIYYRWEGEHEQTRGQRYGGGGQFEFDDLRLETASGYFYDTNFAALHDHATTRIKRCGLYRCSAEDEETMKTPWSKEAKALVRFRVAELDGR
jgi:hypothetical protein